MQILLDTNALLWWLDDSPRLGRSARLANMDATTVYVSLATIWEIGINISIGKLRLPAPPQSIIANSGFEELRISMEHVVAAPRLPFIHRDPFDRLLIAHAQTDRLLLLTADDRIPTHQVETIDATR